MYCPRCGDSVEDEASSCSACGAQITPVGDRPSSSAPERTIDGGPTRNPGDVTPLEPGTVFHDRYRLEEALGQGATGTVYLALDQVTEKTVCIKVIRPEWVSSPGHVRRFLREGKITRRLRHRNLVSVLDVSVAGGMCYLTMEHLCGAPMRHWLRRNLERRHDVPLHVARRIVTEILAGLEAAHAEGLIHDDLKPENVMLLTDPEKEAVRLKLLDFGIARPLVARENPTTTEGGLGTPVYRAPEQETEAETAGPEADLYAVAVMLYEILCGVPPRGRWELPTSLRSDLPDAVDAFFERGLHFHAARRFPDVRTFRRALGEVEVAATPKAPPPRRRTPEAEDAE